MISSRRTPLVFAVAVWIATVPVAAVPPDELSRSEIRQWGPAQGLPEETIYSISETLDGYLWLASRDGLIRFDGQNFRVFSPGESTGFRDNALGGAAAVGEQLWVATRDYVGCAQPDVFHSFTNVQFRTARVPEARRELQGPVSLQRFGDGAVYLRLAEGVYRLPPRAQCQPPLPPLFYLPAPAGESLSGFSRGPSGRNWVAAGTRVYQRGLGQWEALAGPAIGSASLLEGRDGTLWVYGNEGLFTYRGGELQPFPLPAKIAPDALRALFEDMDGDIWVGLTGALARIRKGKLTLLGLEHAMRPGDFVKAITQSRDGGIWAGTNWGSLLRIDAPVFQTIGFDDGLGEESITAVTGDSSGRVWIGSRAKGIYARQDGRLHQLANTNQAVLHAMAHVGHDTLLYANLEGLWVQRPEGSALVAAAPSRVISHYRSFSPSYGTHLYYNDSQTIYRIALPLPAHPRLEKVAQVPLVRSMLEASDGLWALSWNQGLFHISANGALKRFPLDQRQEVRGFTLFALSPEYFLVGSSTGVMLFDRQAERFLTRPPLFEKDQIFQILADQRSHMWLAGRRALLAVSPKMVQGYARGEYKTVLPFRIAGQQGLSSTNFGLGTSSGAYLDTQGEMWLASVGGVIHFQPGEVVGNERLPCAIAAIFADGSELPVSSPLTIPAGVRRLEVQYTVLNRQAGRNPVFRYRLEADSSAWTETNLMQAFFTNIAPGDYKFQVQARLTSVDWSPPASIEFHVEPHWYERRSVRFAGFVLFLAAIALAVRLRGRRIEGRNVELEARVLARTEELAQARDAAEAGNRAKADFLASMSHEIRTPMNGVIGMVEVLKQTPLNPDQVHLLSIISESGETLIAILNDILDFSKIEAGAIVLESSPFCLGELIKHCHDLLAPQAASRSLVFDVVVDPMVPEWVIGDSTRLRQIVLNLASNALKFTPSGRVWVQVKSAGADTTSISVSDTGIGIAADKLSSIFDAFTQAESSTTRRFGGTGLGLTICHRLAAAMGGDLRVESTLGKGSTFTVTLPLAAIPAPPLSVAEPEEQAKSEARSETRLRRILVVEDNPVNRHVAARLLANLECDVTFAHNGNEGVAAACSRPFDAILMDCHMPGMDGFEATRQIRSILGAAGSPPIVAFTADAQPEDRQKCIDVGMSGFLSKPIRIDDLRRLLVSLEAEPSEARIQ